MKRVCRGRGNHASAALAQGCISVSLAGTTTIQRIRVGFDQNKIHLMRRSSIRQYTYGPPGVSSLAGEEHVGPERGAPPATTLPVHKYFPATSIYSCFIYIRTIEKLPGKEVHCSPRWSWVLDIYGIWVVIYPSSYTHT